MGTGILTGILGLVLGTNLAAGAPAPHDFYGKDGAQRARVQDVSIKDGYGSGVNMGAALKAILGEGNKAVKRGVELMRGEAWFAKNVIKSYDKDTATISVRRKDALDKDAETQIIRPSDIVTRLITHDYDWGDAVALAFVKADWPTVQGPGFTGALETIEVPQLLEALTGIKHETIWKKGDGWDYSKWTADALHKYKNKRTPVILQTGNYPEDHKTRLKPRYAYAVVYDDKGAKLVDPSGGDSFDLYKKDSTQYFKDAEYIYGLKNGYELR